MTDEQPATPCISWIFHPARHAPTKTVVSLAIIAFFLVLIAVFYGFFWVILGLLFLFASLNSYFLPTAYELTDDAVVIKKVYYKNRRLFKDFRRPYLLKNGILLSPFLRPTFLNNFRGIFLYYPREPERREQIAAFIKERYPDPDAPVTSPAKKT